jgi:hypothetical protein
MDHIKSVSLMRAMTCMVGNFSDPYQTILTEALLLKTNGGIAAAWSPTGLSDDAQASILNTKVRPSSQGGRPL